MADMKIFDGEDTNLRFFTGLYSFQLYFGFGVISFSLVAVLAFMILLCFWFFSFLSLYTVCFIFVEVSCVSGF